MKLRTKNWVDCDHSSYIFYKLSFIYVPRTCMWQTTKKWLENNSKAKRAWSYLPSAVHPLNYHLIFHLPMYTSLRDSTNYKLFFATLFEFSFNGLSGLYSGCWISSVKLLTKWFVKLSKCCFPINGHSRRINCQSNLLLMKLFEEEKMIQL